MSEYANCDICDELPGTHEIAWGGVRCDECRDRDRCKACGFKMAECSCHKKCNCRLEKA